MVLVFFKLKVEHVTQIRYIETPARRQPGIVTLHKIQILVAQGLYSLLMSYLPLKLTGAKRELIALLLFPRS